MQIKNSSMGQGHVRSFRDYGNSNENILVYLSLALLLISCVDNGLTGSLSKCVWLVSVVAISAVNIGGAFGVYIASAAIYSVMHFGRVGSFLERPDNVALVIIIVFVVFTRFKEIVQFKNVYLGGLISVFIVVPLVHAASLGILDGNSFRHFMRAYGLPFVVSLLLMNSRLSVRELKLLLRSVVLLGVYIAAISIMESIGLYWVLIPTWIADPGLNSTIGTGRSGGLAMQFEINGLALSLIYCILMLSLGSDKRENSGRKYIMSTLFLAGIFVTYTRGAWLALAVAFPFLLLAGGDTTDRRGLKRLLFACIAIISVMLAAVGVTVQRRVTNTDTVHYRLSLWTAGLRMVSRHPVLGHGIWQFRNKVHEYGGEVTWLAVKRVEKRAHAAHNTFLMILVEHGLLGLAIFLAIVLGLYLEARHSIAAVWPRDGPLWLMAFTIVYFVNVQFIAAYEPVTNIIYYGTMGAIAGLARS